MCYYADTHLYALFRPQNSINHNTNWDDEHLLAFRFLTQIKYLACTHHARACTHVRCTHTHTSYMYFCTDLYA